MKRALIVLAVAISIAGCASPTPRVGVASKGRLGAGDSLGLNLQQSDGLGHTRRTSEFAVYPQD